MSWRCELTLIWGIFSISSLRATTVALAIESSQHAVISSLKSFSSKCGSFPFLRAIFRLRLSCMVKGSKFCGRVKMYWPILVMYSWGAKANSGTVSCWVLELRSTFCQSCKKQTLQNQLNDTCSCYKDKGAYISFSDGSQKMLDRSKDDVESILVNILAQRVQWLHQVLHYTVIVTWKYNHNQRNLFRSQIK